MKRIIVVSCAIIGIVLSYFLCSTVTNHDEEGNMSQTFDINDFSSIEIGTSTFHDVYSIAPPENLTVTSYGAMCEYLTTDGGTLRIEFLGSDMTVGAIKYLSDGN